MGKVATSILPSRGSPPLQSGGGGGTRSGPQVGKVATSPLPSRGSPPLQSGGKNQKWPNCGQSGYVTPAVSGIPHRCRAGGKITSGPLMGKVATSPLPSRGSPTLQSGGGKSEVAHLWAKWLRHPYRLGDPHRFRAGEKSEVAHLWAKWLRHPCRLGDPHRCRAGGGGDEKWPTSGQSGYVTPAVSGIPIAAERGGGGG